MQLLWGKRPDPGSAPGAVHSQALHHAVPATLSIVDYRAGEFEEHEDVDLAAARPFFSSPRNTWLHVQGEPEPGLLRDIGEAYGLHPLAMADVINGGQRTKSESYPNQEFIVMHYPRLEDGTLELEQVSIFLGKTYVVSFHRAGDNIFEPVRERLRNNPESRLRTFECDYLVYALIDLIIDSSFPVLEHLGERLETLEDEVLDRPTRDTLDQIHLMRRELILLRRAQWPQREVLNSLLRSEDGAFASGTRIYLRDCYDHTIQVMDLLENYREMSSGLLEVYLSSLSNRMNDVMKVLTVIATIFIPLSFLAGVYGMNFDTRAGPLSMPELSWPLGYIFFWVMCVILAGIMVALFHRKGWF